MKVSPINLAVSLIVVLAVGIYAYGDTQGLPSSPSMKPAPTYNPELETKLGRIFDLIDAFLDDPQMAKNWPSQRISEVYAPVSCSPPPSGHVPSRIGARRTGTPRFSIVHDGEEIMVGSKEFEAMEVQVDPVEGLPVSCKGKICEAIVPASIYRNAHDVASAALNRAGYISDPRIIIDRCETETDWCTQFVTCRQAGREWLYFRPLDRTKVEMTQIQVGRASGSLKLKFVRDSEPFCDPVFAVFHSEEHKPPSFCLRRK